MGDGQAAAEIRDLAPVADARPKPSAEEVIRLSLIPTPIHEKHEARYEAQRAKWPKSPVDVLAIGDRMVYQWPRAALLAAFKGCSVVRAGLGGLEARHLLWMITSGHFDALKPRIILLGIGSNNLARDPDGGTTAEAIRIVVSEVQRRWNPKLIYVVAIAPRGEGGSFKPEHREKANGALREALASMSSIRFLEVDHIASEPWGLREDQIHLSDRGYEVLTTNLRDDYAKEEPLPPRVPSAPPAPHRQPSKVRQFLDRLVAMVP